MSDALGTLPGTNEQRLLDQSPTAPAATNGDEVRYGSFERSIALPEGIKAEDLKATYRDGVLELSAPMPKESVPKEVKIQIEASKGNGKKAEAA